MCSVGLSIGDPLEAAGIYIYRVCNCNHIQNSVATYTKESIKEFLVVVCVCSEHVPSMQAKTEGVLVSFTSSIPAFHSTLDWSTTETESGR